MSVVIRMRRTGAKGRPFYRVVVADSRYARDGRYIEQLGYYDPLTDPAKFIIDAAKFEMWIRRGAQPSDEVMMAKHAPAALRPAPLPVVESQESPAAAPKAPRAKKAKAKAKAAPKGKAKAAAKATKGSEKKKKTKAKAKARKQSGIAKPKKTKKAKSKK